MTPADDALLEQRLGHKFVRPALLHDALTHSSAVPEMRATQSQSDNLKGAVNNERLEFLGDAVLELLTSEYLLEAFPDWTEGQLSRSRARLVNARSLEAAARRLGLGDHLRLGRGEEKTGGRQKHTLLADAFEAVLAAVYLDAGLAVVREVLRHVLFEQALEEVGEHMAESDRKSALQELLQSRGVGPCRYHVIEESGPDHEKTFRVEVRIPGEITAIGTGRTKKEAQQSAATAALIQLGLAD